MLRPGAGERIDRLVVVADDTEVGAAAEPLIEQRLLQQLTSWYSSTVKARYRRRKDSSAAPSRS
jgi:hypothetical protein